MPGQVKWWPQGLRWRVAPALVLLVTLFVVAGQVDAALGRIEAPGYPSASWGSLVSFHPSSNEARTAARTAWCVWFNTRGPDPGPYVQACLDAFASEGHDRVLAPTTGGAEARLLIRWYVAIDAVLILLYAWLLSRALIALGARVRSSEDPSPSLRRATQPSRRRLLIGALVVVEAVEDTHQWKLSGRDMTPERIDELFQIVGWAAVCKWALVVLAVFQLIVLIARTRAWTTQP
ncbi:hypothetical protein ACFWWM_01270 [Streptomyces sp. NPDC058682]|uniref:hypothetical protein n=1 Tax=Streptomyces sp. NPDC058682 TaxID=3346596 RepID=UPI003651CE00